VKMKNLVSPIELGDTLRTGILACVPIVRQVVYGTQWQRYYRSIRRQITTRGPVPNAAWVSEERCSAARRIEGILKEMCWGDDFTFHPDDPYRVVGDWEVGDLSEVEALAEIGEDFGVQIDQDAIARLVEKGLTFGGFVDYVLNLQRRG
jgi:hypothetical protein